jgi:hypothetical protein
MGGYCAWKNPVDQVAVEPAGIKFESNTRPENPLASRRKFLSEAG